MSKKDVEANCVYSHWGLLSSTPELRQPGDPPAGRGKESEGKSPVQRLMYGWVQSTPCRLALKGRGIGRPELPMSVRVSEPSSPSSQRGGHALLPRGWLAAGFLSVGLWWESFVLWLLFVLVILSCIGKNPEDIHFSGNPLKKSEGEQFLRNRKMREREITKKGDRCRDRKREMGARKGRESVSWIQLPQKYILRGSLGKWFNKELLLWGLTKEKVLVPQFYLTLCGPMDCTVPDFFVHGILRVRILKWVAIPFYRGSARPRDWT